MKRLTIRYAELCKKILIARDDANHLGFRCRGLIHQTLTFYKKNHLAFYICKSINFNRRERNDEKTDITIGLR